MIARWGCAAGMLIAATLVTACTGDDASRAGGAEAGAPDASMAGVEASTADGGVALRVTTNVLVIDKGDGGNAVVDPNLVNPWGLAITPAGLLAVVDNGQGTISEYTADVAADASTISILGPGDVGAGAPSGEVYNPASGDFEGDTLIVVTEEGTIDGWKTAGTASPRVDESATGAVFKGVDILESPTGRVLVVANFHAATIELFDASYARVPLSSGAFVDPNVTTGFAPFNVFVSGANVFVAYAKQDDMQQDDVAGPGNGLVDVFNETGTFLRRLVTGGELNSPWALALAPADYSLLGGALIVGNFGNGAVLAFDPASGAAVGRLANPSGAPFSIEGLWALRFGQDQPMEAHTQLFFTAGVGGEAHGVFGRLDLAL